MRKGTREIGRGAFLLACGVATVSTGAMLYLLVRTLSLPSPIWGEWETVFTAERIRAGLPIYIDPNVGARDYGPVPSFSLAGYPPLASALFALFPDPALGGKLLSSAVWWGALFGSALTARRENLAWSLLVALLMAGVWTTGVWALSARPDSLAVGAVALALALVGREQRVGIAAAMLLALAAWIKPNVAGAALGLMTGQLVLAPRLAMRAAGAILATSLVVGGVLFAISGGTFLKDVFGATAAPFDTGDLGSRLASMAPFFAVPLLVGVTKLIRGGRDSALLAAALIGCVVWLPISFAKGGSAGNYWMELSVVLVVVVSRTPPTPLSLPWGCLVLAQSLWNGAATLGGVRVDIQRRDERAAFVLRARHTCLPSADRVVLSDDPGIELAVNDRIVADLLSPIMNGTASADTWRKVVEDPAIVCFAEHTHVASVLPEVWSAVDARFSTDEVGDYKLYRRRTR